MVKQWKPWQDLFDSKLIEDGDSSHKIERLLLLGRKAMTNLNSILKSRDITFPTKVHLVKAFSRSHVWMWGLDHKESWATKNWCFWTVVLEKTLERPLDCKEIQPVNPKANQSWTFIGNTDAEAEVPILWLPDVKNCFVRKDPDAGKDWRQEDKGMTQDEMVGWHHRLNGQVWANLGSWWWRGGPGMRQSMGSQRVRHDWATELNQKHFLFYKTLFPVLWLDVVGFSWDIFGLWLLPFLGCRLL